MILFESPHRVGALLQDAYTVLGDRKGAVCYEMTKKFERVHRGFLTELPEQIRSVSAKGEVTVVIAGNHVKFRRET